jgi:hypothetical protein
MVPPGVLGMEPSHLSLYAALKLFRDAMYTSLKD